MAYRAAVATQVGTGTSINAAIPSGTAIGDTLVVFASVNAAETSISLPSGWTAIGSQVLSGSSAYIAGYKVVASGDPSTVGITWASTSGKADVIVAAYSGIASLSGSVASESTSQGTHTTPTLTTSSATVVLTACFSKVSAGTTITASSGTVRLTDTTGGGGSLIGGLADSDTTIAAGSVGGTVWTVNAASAQAAMWTIAMVPAVAVVYNTNTDVTFGARVIPTTRKAVDATSTIVGKARHPTIVTQRAVNSAASIVAKAKAILATTQKRINQSTTVKGRSAQTSQTYALRSGDQRTTIAARAQVLPITVAKAVAQSTAISARAVVSLATQSGDVIVVTPAAFPTYLIDGVDLNNSNWMITNDSAVRGLAAVQAVSIKMAGRPGELPIVDEDFDTADHNITVGVFGASQQEMDLWLQALYGVLGQRNRLLTLQRWFSPTQVQQVRAKLVAGLKPTQVAPNSCTVELLFEIPGVFWRDISTPDWTVTPTANGIYQVSTLDGSTGPIFDAILLLTGPVANPQITDLNSGQTVMWQGILNAGEQLRIDVGAWFATVGPGVGWTGLGADVTGQLQSLGAKSQAVLLRLTSSFVGGDPMNRQVQIKTTGDGMTSDTSLSIRARRSFL